MAGKAPRPQSPCPGPPRSGPVPEIRAGTIPLNSRRSPGSGTLTGARREAGRLLGSQIGRKCKCQARNQSRRKPMNQVCGPHRSVSSSSIGPVMTDGDVGNESNRSGFLADSGRGETRPSTGKHALCSRPGQMVCAGTRGVSSKNPAGVVKKDELAKLKGAVQLAIPCPACIPPPASRPGSGDTC